MHEQFTDQLSARAVIVFILQWLKNQSWFPWLSEKTDNLNRSVAVILSGLAAAGIHMTFDTEAGTLTVTGLTLATVVTGGWAWLKSYASQEMIYRIVKASRPVVAPRDVWTDEMRAAKSKPEASNVASGTDSTRP